jgi:hypothetical protein
MPKVLRPLRSPKPELSVSESIDQKICTATFDVYGSSTNVVPTLSDTLDHQPTVVNVICERFFGCFRNVH